MEKFNKIAVVSALFGLGALMMSLNAGAATTASTEFSATIAFEGACDISAPSTVVFNNGNDVLPSEIESGVAAAEKRFDITLANCTGINVTPKITITGQSNNTTGETLFLDAATSDATGYGILLSTTGNTNFKENKNLASNKNISVNDNWDLTTRLSALNGTIPIIAKISCGTCETEGRLGGTLKSNMTFEFAYD